MDEFFASTVAFLAGVSPLGWTATVSLVTSLIASVVSIWNAQRLLGIQRDALAVQHLSNARSASTFIADKRQKWIDDLRNDASKLIALSLETAEAWKQLYSKCVKELYDNRDPLDALKQCDVLRVEFVNSNALRDSEHHQLYMRIILRLNIEEDVHKELTKTLENLRADMAALASLAQKGNYNSSQLFDIINASLKAVEDNTRVILKQEWQRLKREVADPDKLIQEILSSS